MSPRCHPPHRGRREPRRSLRRARRGGDLRGRSRRARVRPWTAPRVHWLHPSNLGGKGLFDALDGLAWIAWVGCCAPLVRSVVRRVRRYDTSSATGSPWVDRLAASMATAVLLVLPMTVTVAGATTPATVAGRPAPSTASHSGESWSPEVPAVGFPDDEVAQDYLRGAARRLVMDNRAPPLRRRGRVGGDRPTQPGHVDGRRDTIRRSVADPSRVAAGSPTRRRVTPRRRRDTFAARAIDDRETAHPDNLRWRCAARRRAFRCRHIEPRPLAGGWLLRRIGRHGAANGAVDQPRAAPRRGISSARAERRHRRALGGRPRSSSAARQAIGRMARRRWTLARDQV